MRWLQEDRLEDKPWIFRVAHLFRSLLFFEELIPSNHNSHHMNVDYGISEQADRVRRLFAQAPGKLSHDPTPQAVFLIGACCSRIELIQQNVRGSAPFASKLKGFRLNERDVRTLFRAAKEKGSSYGDDEERKVAGLLQCAGSALFASPDQWSLSPDEVSYFFALGHALRPRLAKAAEEDATNG
jgi:CRISPR-associated protein Cas8b/Csh1 subtype I-B